MASGKPAEPIPVESSSLRYVAYDRDSERLEVAFRHGGVYEYEAVPPRIVRDLLRAESKGRYFMQRIRNQYRTRRLR
jgi:hypothetical protein